MISRRPVHRVLAFSVVRKWIRTSNVTFVTTIIYDDNKSRLHNRTVTVPVPVNDPWQPLALTDNPRGDYPIGFAYGQSAGEPFVGEEL